MLTNVYLEGPLGEELGREWAFEISTPAEALRMIDANGADVISWIRKNADRYPQYQIVVEYGDGVTEELSEATYDMNRKMSSVSFVPIIEGAGGAFQAVVGAAFIVVGFCTGNYPLMLQGAMMLIGGIIAMTAARPSAKSVASDTRSDKKSDYFDGPVNTTEQGVPVPLIYGTCRVGSHVISASISVGEKQ